MFPPSSFLKRKVVEAERKKFCQFLDTLEKVLRGRGDGKSTFLGEAIGDIGGKKRKDGRKDFC